MGAKTWSRQNQQQSFVTGSETNATTSFTMGYWGGATGDDTIIRTILDIRCTAVLNDTTGGGPAEDWWSTLRLEFVAGRQDFSSPTGLNITGAPDPNVVGSGLLDLTGYWVGQGLVATHVAHYALRVTMDSHGQRKALAPGVGFNTLAVAIQAQPGTVCIDPALDWSLDWFAYGRVLFETP